MKQQTNKTECYYAEYGVCTCTYSKNCDNACAGQQACEKFISGDDYFAKMLAGELPKETPENTVVKKKGIPAALMPEKTKKQLKYERRQEEKKNGDGTGYKLLDDPKFKDIFSKLK